MVIICGSVATNVATEPR